MTAITSDPGHHAATLGSAIVNTIRLPLLVLNGEMQVIALSPSFSQTFMVLPKRPSAVCSLTSAMANGTSRRFGISWRM